MNLWNTLKAFFTPPITPEAPIPAVQEVPLPSTKYTRTEVEKAQIAEFRSNHADFLEKLEDAVYDSNHRMIKAEDPLQKMDFCKKTIRAYEKLKTVCNSSGPGGALYFEDMWEHCSNSTNPDFRFIEAVEAILEDLDDPSPGLY